MTSHFDALTWPVATERLRIRPAVADDADAVGAYRRRPEVDYWMTRLVPDDAAAYREHFGAEHRLAVTLVLERDGSVIGDLMLKVDDAWAQAEVAEQAKDAHAELGWALAVEHQGQGLMTEAVQALLGIAFEGVGVRRVTAECFAENEPSWRLMERVGMRREAHWVRDGLHRELGWRDAFVYALLREEWEAATGRS